LGEYKRKKTKGPKKRGDNEGAKGDRSRCPYCYIRVRAGDEPYKVIKENANKQGKVERRKEKRRSCYVARRMAKDGAKGEEKKVWYGLCT